MNILGGFRAQVLAAGSVAQRLMGDRLHPEVAPPQQITPFGTYTRMPSVRRFTHDGPSKLVTARLSVTVWVDDADTAFQIADDIRSRLNGFTGNIGGSGITVQSSIMVGDYPRFDPDTQLYGEIRDFSIMYQET